MASRGPFQQRYCRSILLSALSLAIAGVTVAAANERPVVHAMQNEYMKTLRRHVAARYVDLLKTNGLWDIKGQDPRALFWREEQKRQISLGGLGPAPTPGEMVDLLVGLPEGEVYDFMMTVRMTDRCLSDYIAKQDRLISIADTTSSEIKIIDSSERTGKTGLKDFQFLLTIDDGPSAYNRNWLLNELELAGVKAVFFLIGGEEADAAGGVEPYLTRGHDVGMHTSTIDFEFDPTCRMVDPVMDRKWFRAHGGSRTLSYTASVRDLGAIHLLWNIDSRDWEFIGFPGTAAPLGSGTLEERVDQVVASAVAVSIVRAKGVALFHETVKAAPETIGRYVRLMKALGCEFVTPEAAWEAFAPEPPTERPEHPDGL